MATSTCISPSRHFGRILLLLLYSHKSRPSAKRQRPVDLLKGFLEPVLFDIGLGSYLGTMIIILYFYMPSLLQTQYGVDRSTAFYANTAALLSRRYAQRHILGPLWHRSGAGAFRAH
jgi:hypothetical protein